MKDHVTNVEISIYTSCLQFCKIKTTFLYENNETPEKTNYH